MKKLLSGAILLFSTMSFSQESEFKFEKEGFTDFIVVNCDGKTKEELYKKALDWINITYKNPKEVIKSQIDNEYIRIEGSSESLICSNVKCYNSKYQIELSFKDGKYKFDIIEITYYVEPTKYDRGGWGNIEINNVNKYYKDNGNIRNNFKNFPLLIPQYFNSLNLQLHDYLISNSVLIDKSNW